MSKFSKLELESLYIYRDQYESMLESLEERYENEKTEYFKREIRKEIKEIEGTINELNDWISFRENNDLQDWMDMISWDDD